MKAMKYINKIINNLITDIYKIDILRTSIVLIRFFYFFCGFYKIYKQIYA